MINKSLYWVFLGVSALLFGDMIWTHGNDGLWNDEIYTLRNFVFQGLPTVMSDYHVPNNHILSNVFHWLWIQLSGITDLGQLLDQAWRIRLWPGLLAFATIGMVYRLGRQATDPLGGAIAVVVLLTTLAFGNFALQVRGYSLSMLLITGLIYGAFRVLSAQAVDRISVAALALSVLGLLYTIPSNLYVVAGAGIMLAVLLGKNHKRTVIIALSAMSGGGLAAVALYLPMFDQVTNNEYITAGRSFRTDHIILLKTTLEHFLNWRFLLLPLLVLGWRATPKGDLHRQQLILLGGVFLLPFAASLVRGDTPPMRTYTVLIPVFALFIALAWSAAARQWEGRGNWVTFIHIGGLLVCVASYWYGKQEIVSHLKTTMSTFRYDQDLNYNYYQFCYAPNEEFDLFKQTAGTGATLILERSEAHDLPVYLAHKGITFLPGDSLAVMMEREKTVYVSTRFPQVFLEKMEQVPGWQFSFLQDKARYPRILVGRKE